MAHLVLGCVILLVAVVSTDDTTETPLCDDTTRRVSNCKIFTFLYKTQNDIVLLNQNAIGLQGHQDAQHEEVREELQTLKGRLAAAAALSVTQLLMVIVYLVVKVVMYLVNCVKK